MIFTAPSVGLGACNPSVPTGGEHPHPSPAGLCVSRCEAAILPCLSPCKSRTLPCKACVKWSRFSLCLIPLLLPHVVCVFVGSAASCRRQASALQSFCPAGIALLLAAALHPGSVLVSQPYPQPPNGAVLPAVTFSWDQGSVCMLWVHHFSCVCPSSSLGPFPL